MNRPEPIAAPRRLRDAYAIVDPDGGCSLIYDLERTFVVEVPEGLRAEVGSSLEAGLHNSAALSGWLAEEDLMTSQPRRSWAQGDHPDVPQLTDVSLDMSGNCNMGCIYCFEDDIKSRIGPMSEKTARASLDFAFAKARDADRIALHFGSGEPLIRFDLLKLIVAEAGRRAREEGKAISYDLTTNATLVTDEIACFLRDHPFAVRVSCDGPARLHDRLRPLRGGQSSYAAVERGLRILLRHLPDRLTVNSVVCGGTRLAELWTWAKQIGLRHFHVIKVGAHAGRDINLQRAELAEFRTDLEAICAEMFEDLEQGRTPIDFQPITKVVRRLMIPEPITRFCGVAGSYLGIASNGQVYPCFRHLGLEEHGLGDVWNGVSDDKRQKFLGAEAADVDSRPVCRDCWARYLCGGGCYADSVVYGPDRLKPQEQHCPFWRTEIEVAIRFFDRLRRDDPGHCLRLFGDDPDGLLDDPGSGGLEFVRQRNCQ
jgi:uncharacterized protein